eukprot:501048_1
MEHPKAFNDPLHRKLPVIHIEGDCPYQIGFNHGRILKDKISKCYAVYEERMLQIFKSSSIADELRWIEWIKSCCVEYIHLLARYEHTLQHIIDEMRGIAEGSELPLWKIYFINARGEIFGLAINGYKQSDLESSESDVSSETTESTERINEFATECDYNEFITNECTTILSKKNAVLSQNWDWLRYMEPLVVVLNMNGEILTMTEAGMVAKVGFNKHGLGCTINSLARPNAYLDPNLNTNVVNGIPIHMIMKHLLVKYASVKQIQESDIISKLPVNRFIGIGILDSHQQGHYVEYCGLNNCDVLLLPDDSLSFHTNHFLGCGLSMVEQEMTRSNPGTLHRMKQLKKLYYDDESEIKDCQNDVDVCKLLLTNNEQNNGYSVFRKWVQFKWVTHYKYGEVGTVCAIVMDLKKKIMHITREKDACLMDTSTHRVKFDQIELNPTKLKQTKCDALLLIDQIIHTIM